MVRRIVAVVLLTATAGCGAVRDTTASKTSPEDIATGSAWISAHGCASCHQGAAQGVLAGSTTPLLGTEVYASNLTPDMDTGLGKWTDAQIIAALRLATGANGHRLCSQMPATAISDADAKAVVAYLRSIPAVQRAIPESDCEQEPPASHGKELVGVLGCASCHTAVGGATLSGSDTAVPGTMAYAPNLTPDGDTGLGSWSDDQIAGALRTGVDDEGQTLCTAMPRFASLSDADAHAIAAYLRTLPAVAHAVPESECPAPSAGEELVEKLACGSCHTPSAGPPLTGSDRPVPGTLAYGPNLTPDPDTGIGSWSDDQVIGAIRRGIDDEGQSLCNVMPRFSGLSDADAQQIVAYLHSLPPVAHQVQESQCVAPPSHGELLVGQLACGSCHTPAGGAALSGSDTAVPGTKAYAPNLTPDEETGIGSWTDDQVAAAIRTAVDDQGQQLCVMPSFSTLSDADAKDLVLYLRSLAPVAHQVPESGCESGDADAGEPGPDAAPPAGDDAGSAADAGQAGPDAGTSGACDPQVVVSQIFGGGGDLGAALHNDFVELHNRGATPVSLTGWSVQYAASTGTAWQVTALAGSIAPGGYYLVQEGANSTGGGASLPTPDATGAINLAATKGKVALSTASAALAGACPASTAVVDLVGYGAANCPVTGLAPALSATTSLLRAGAGCTDTGSLASDFLKDVPAPRSSATAPLICACP